MAWTTPKTDWVSTDWLNAVDYNRIKNNLLYLSDLCNQLFSPVFSTSLGSDKTYSDWAYADEWNAIETRLEEINAYSVHVSTYGTQKTFYDNGKGIDADELNRIESASLDLYTRLVDVAGGRRRLRFRLLSNSFDNF